MPVSAGLQSYFDKKGSSKQDIKQKLKKIEGSIDPAFLQSFQVFHDKILGIVDEASPQEIGIVHQEMERVDMKLQNARRKHNLKKASSILRHTE